MPRTDRSFLFTPKASYDGEGRTLYLSAGMWPKRKNGNVVLWFIGPGGTDDVRTIHTRGG